MDALKIQLKKELDELNPTIETVFIGGGTPSCIKASLYEEIFELIFPYVLPHAEITTEANPNSATTQWLEQMFSYGVNRISFGVQSFDDKKLQFLGRAHTAQKAIEAIQTAQKVGFKRINCDLIYGVFNDNFELLKKDIDIITTLPVDHISAYSLTLEEGTPFFQKNSVKIDDEVLSKEVFDYLEELGFKQYEISNFAKNESSRSRHNMGYWEHQEYLGIGAGAVGYYQEKRYYPSKNIEHYIQNPLEYKQERLSLADIKMEKVLLGFRCIAGVHKELLTPKELQKVQELVKEKQLIIDNHRIMNPNYLLADELALYILD